MFGDGHVRFGGRFAETEQPKRRHRAAGRPYNLTDRQQAKLAWIEQVNQPLFRAYLLKEQLRQIYRLPAQAATLLLDGWLKWARRCRLRSFVKLARTITDQRAGIVAAIEHQLSNEWGLSEELCRHERKRRSCLRLREAERWRAGPRRSWSATGSLRLSGWGSRRGCAATIAASS
jgi:hypothetical protein